MITPRKIRPRTDTFPVKGHFLSMYVPSIASLGVLIPRPTFLYQRPRFLPIFPTRETAPCFKNAFSCRRSAMAGCDGPGLAVKVFCQCAKVIGDGYAASRTGKAIYKSWQQDLQITGPNLTRSKSHGGDRGAGCCCFVIEICREQNINQISFEEQNLCQSILRKFGVDAPRTRPNLNLN
jgi:hypothetical protein